VYIADSVQGCYPDKSRHSDLADVAGSLMTRIQTGQFTPSFGQDGEAYLSHRNNVDWVREEQYMRDQLP
jgi:hypothetical protein